MENISSHESNNINLSGNPGVSSQHGSRGPPPAHLPLQPQPSPVGAPGPMMMPQGPPQLPPQMFTTAAQLLDLTDSEEYLSSCFSLWLLSKLASSFVPRSIGSRIMDL